MWQEVVNEDYRKEKDAQRNKDSKPYRQIVSSQNTDYPIHYFTVDSIRASSITDKTYYSSDRGLLEEKIQRLLLDLFARYKNRDGYKKVRQGRKIIAWNFYITKGHLGMPPAIAIAVSTIYEA